MMMITGKKQNVDHMSYKIKKNLCLMTLNMGHASGKFFTVEHLRDTALIFLSIYVFRRYADITIRRGMFDNNALRELVYSYVHFILSDRWRSKCLREAV